MEKLSAFQRDTLYAVGKLQDPHGLAIKQQLEAYYNSEVNHGRLYPNLDQLVERGLIDKGQKNDRTNEYQLTDRAREMIRNRREWESIDEFL